MPTKLQVRIDRDVEPKVREAARAKVRSIPAEVNHRLRTSFGVKRNPLKGHYSKP
jgi:hypothetical protein